MIDAVDSDESDPSHLWTWSVIEFSAYLNWQELKMSSVFVLWWHTCHTRPAPKKWQQGEGWRLKLKLKAETELWDNDEWCLNYETTMSDTKQDACLYWVFNNAICMTETTMSDWIMTLTVKGAIVVKTFIGKSPKLLCSRWLLAEDNFLCVLNKF